MTMATSAADGSPFTVTYRAMPTPGSSGFFMLAAPHAEALRASLQNRSLSVSSSSPPCSAKLWRRRASCESCAKPAFRRGASSGRSGRTRIGVWSSRTYLNAGGSDGVAKRSNSMLAPSWRAYRGLRITLNSGISRVQQVERVVPASGAGAVVIRRAVILALDVERAGIVLGGRALAGVELDPTLEVVLLERAVEILHQHDFGFGIDADDLEGLRAALVPLADRNFSQPFRHDASPRNAVT